mmetsp:Transcript_14218/g.22147  ORF Transcript_14218/g.22147 Transcript_14218/m.22147 type:complete len:118 (+) Transcript_14218:1008-1361(+)
MNYSPEKMPVKYNTNRDDPIVEVMKANRSNVKEINETKMSKHNFKYQQNERSPFDSSQKHYAKSFTEESKMVESDSDAELIAEAKKAILEFEQFRINQDGEVEPASLKKLEQLKEFV